MNPTRAKRALRVKISKQILQSAGAMAPDAGILAAECLKRASEFRAASNLYLFAARDDEFPTRPIFEMARSAGKRCLLPRCMPEFELEFAEISAWLELEPAAYGLMEPPDRLPTVQAAPGDLMLVPGLAFDRAGRRLGRGRGYYDRYLARRPHPPLALFGLAFAFQRIDRVPVEPHDWKMDAILSETGLERPAK